MLIVWFGRIINLDKCLPIRCKWRRSEIWHALGINMSCSVVFSFAGTSIPKKSPSNVRSAGRASVSPGLWPSTKHYTCRSRNWSQPRSSDRLCQQGKDRDTGKNHDQRRQQAKNNQRLFFTFSSRKRALGFCVHTPQGWNILPDNS